MSLPISLLPDPDSLWWFSGAAVLLFAWSLTPIRSKTSARPHGSAAEGVLAIYPLLWVLPPPVVGSLLRGQPGVQRLELDIPHGVARVTFDPGMTSLASLRTFTDDCYRHCAGERPPAHVCPPQLNDG